MQPRSSKFSSHWLMLAMCGIAMFSMVTSLHADVLLNSGDISLWPAAPIIETYDPDPNGSSTTEINNAGAKVGQGFTVGGLPLQIDKIYIAYDAADDVNKSFNLELYEVLVANGTEAPPGQGSLVTKSYVDVDIFDAAFPPDGQDDPGVLEFDFTGADEVVLAAGGTYVFMIIDTDATIDFAWLSNHSGNPYAYVKLGPDGLAALADHLLLSGPILVNRRTGSAHRSTQGPGQLFYKCPFFSATYTPAPGDNHLGLLDRKIFCLFFSHDIENPGS